MKLKSLLSLLGILTDLAWLFRRTVEPPDPEPVSLPMLTEALPASPAPPAGFGLASRSRRARRYGLLPELR